MLGDAISFEAMDIDRLLQEQDMTVPAPLQFAVAQPVAIAAGDVGTIEDLGDGRSAWRFRIESANARSINLAMDWNVPPSTQMYVLDENGVESGRAFGFQDNMDHGELWTFPVNGSVIELYAEVATEELNAFLSGVSIFSVNLGFRDVGQTDDRPGFIGRSDACHVDVNCSQGNPFRDQIDGVGRLLIEGVGFCSGSLVNNTSQNGDPLLLSAYHCFDFGGSPSNVNSLIISWNYQNTFCRAPGSSQSGNNGNGNPSAQATFGGATLLSAVSTADTVVYRLNSIPPNSYGVQYQGWDRRNVSTGATFSVHHPNGEEKRISLDPSSAFQQTANFPGQPNVRTWVADFTEGGTEGGSSGSPLFRQNSGRIIGVLAGGPAGGACNTLHLYGRLQYAWTRGTPNTVGQVLDPVGNGSANTLDLLGGSAAMPSQPVPVSPLNSAIEVSRNATFDWTDSAFTDTYEFYIYSDPAGTNEVYSNTSLTSSVVSLPVNTLDGFTPYWWTVFAVNGNGSTQLQGGLLSFVTETTGGPASPTLVTPTNGATDVPVDVTFDWDPANGADFYQLLVINADTSETIRAANAGDIFTTSFQLPTDLPAGTQINWRIFARNANGVSFSSPTISSFTTAGTAIPECPEDIDMSGGIDITDLLALLAAFDESTAGPYQGGDTTGDGVVDISDLLALLAKFDTACP